MAAMLALAPLAAQPTPPAKPPTVPATPEGVKPTVPPVTARPDEPKAPENPPAARKKAYIRALEPNSVVKTGKDHSVVARGKLQMVIPDDNVIVFCAAVDYSGETTGVATVTGDLRIVTGDIVEKDGTSSIPKPDNTITGLIAWVFTKEKRAVIDGDLDPKTVGKVVVVHTPKKQAPADVNRFERARYQEVKIVADRVTYWYRRGDRKALAQPKAPNTLVTFEQATQKGSAGRATYYAFEKDQSELGDILDLVGGVKVTNDQGESVQAEAARIFVDQETSQWVNITEMVLNVEEGQRNPEEPNGPPPAPGGTKPAAPPTPPPPPPAATR
jgi:hypothetical protein